MALHESALIYTADAKAHIGIASADTTHDALLEVLIAEVSGFIDAYTARTLKEQANVVVRAVGDGTEQLVLPQYPIASVASVVDEDGNTIASSEYTLKGDNGILKHKSSAWDKGVEYAVTCTAGFKTAGQNPSTPNNVTVPYSLRLACVKLVAKAFERRHAEGTTNASSGQSSVGFQRELDTEITTTLDGLKKYHV